MASIIQKTEQIVRNVGSASNADAGGKVIRIPLNRDSLVAEYRISVAVSQAIGVAAPTAADVRRLFTSITLENSDNDRLNNADFPAVYELGRFTEKVPASAIVLGTPASTAEFSFELHLEADESTIDAASFMQSLGMSNLQLVLAVAPDASSIFTGGAGATYGAQNVTVNVEEEAYPDMLGTFPYGSRVQTIQTTTKATNGGTGQQEPIKLMGRNRTRFIGLQAYDVSGALPVLRDDLIGKVQIYVGNSVKRDTTFASLKRTNVNKRDYVVVGSAFIDQGDNETQQFDFSLADDIYLRYETLVAVATRLVVTQVSFTDNGKIVFTRGLVG